MVRRVAVIVAMVMALAGSSREAAAQGRDTLANGAIVGGVAGAAAGVAFTYAVRDSDLVFSQYARSALIFGAIGAGIGLGVDALLQRNITVAPTAAPGAKGVVVRWRW